MGDQLAAQIARARHRADLLQASSRPDAPTSAWERAALEELATCLEELRVAEEEMRAQGQELAAAHSAVDQERARYRELFWTAPHGYVLTDLRAVITEANATACDLLGLPLHGVRGKPLAAFVSLHDRDRFQRWFRQLSRDEDGPPAAEEGTFTLHTFDRGRGVPCRLQVNAQRGPRGEIEELRWVIQDVSDRERARAADRLQEEGRRKDEFLAVLGHELRNPLAAITLAADILAGREHAAGDTRAADIVRRNATQLRRLVDDLLDMSRVAHGRVTLQPVQIDLREVIDSSVETARPGLAGRRHELEVSVGDEPVKVHGDPARLQQIVGNLLDNAAKYTPAGGQIWIDLRADGGAAILAIRDSGIGIPAHMQERIFDLFEQVEGSSDRSERGLGLGLALVRDLVELHGGSVRAHSEGPGRGSCFVVQLPLAPASAPVPAPDGDTARPVALEPLLVVDDNIDAADLLALTLRTRGHEVLVAHTGPEALELVDGSRPIGVALVDLGLPGMDGFELGRRLRGCLPGVVLVAVTGYGDEETRRLAAEAGFAHYLLKPVRPVDVYRVLDRAASPTEPAEAEAEAEAEAG